MNYQPPGYPPPGGYGPPSQRYYQYGPPPQGPAPFRPQTAQHPHAKLALILALCGFFTASITGMIAIFVGSSALKAINAEPGRYTGAGMAKTGVVLGLVECSLAAFVLGRGMSNSSTGTAVVVLLVGLAAAAAPIALAAKRRWAVARAVSFACVPVLLAGGALTGLLDARAEAASRDKSCAKNETLASTQFAAKNYTAASTAIGVARTSCPATESAKIAELSNNINQQLRADAQAEADRAAAQKAQDLAALVASFPQKATEIVASCKRAAGELNAGQWNKAESDVSAAETELGPFADTSIGEGKQWQDLIAQVEGLRKRVDAHRDQLEKQRAARQRAEDIAQDQANLQGLLAQYKDNEVRADAIYKGKIVEFGGLVSDVKKDITNNIFVMVGTGEWLQIPEVQCFFDDNKAGETARLTKGQFVRMKGTVDGLMMNVLVKDCDVVQ